MDGITNNLPIDVLRKMGARRIVGVDLGYNGQLRSDVDNIIENWQSGLGYHGIPDNLF